MKIQKLTTLYFSPNSTTAKTVNIIGAELASLWEMPLEKRNFTTPTERENEFFFSENELVLIGSPTYAGKLPNKILPEFRAKVHGNGALVVPVVTFGNRGYDNALAELCALMEENGFHTVAAGAFVCQHAFTDALAHDRPDCGDQLEMKRFAKSIYNKVHTLTKIPVPVMVPGDAAAPYYVPRGLDGEPVQFLKARPKIDPRKCTGCGICARLCPMGAIDSNCVDDVPGICIKCQRCVNQCPKGARFFDDPAFLSHVAMLQRQFVAPKNNEVFL